jgi:hypothetical protein
VEDRVVMVLAFRLVQQELQIKDSRAAIMSVVLTATKCLLAVVELEALALMTAVETLAQVAQVYPAQSQVRQLVEQAAVVVEM